MTRTASAPSRTPRPRIWADISDKSPENNDASAGWRGVLHTRWASDALVALAFAAFAAWVTHRLLGDPTGRALGQNPNDQALYEWFLAYDTRVWHGDFHLVSDRLNSPNGVNLLANTTVVVLGALFAPVTMAFGAPVTFALLTTLNLAATGWAWYLFLGRVLRVRTPIAIAGGALCGFAPGMVSQANAHLHITAQWLVPMIAWLVVRLWRAAGEGAHRAVLTSGVGLALAVSVQVFIGEETLFLTALTFGFFALAYVAIVRPSGMQMVLSLLGLTVAVGVAVALLAYPLWAQFAGPQHVTSGPFSPEYFYADLASFPAYSPLSIAGSTDGLALSTGYTELNTFLGWPLIVAVLASAVWLRRNATVLAAMISALAMCSLALGPRIVINHYNTGIIGPYALIRGLPVIAGALPMRFALAAIPLAAIIGAIALDQVWSRARRPARLAAAGIALVALVPLLPAPLPTVGRDAVPRFYSEGYWRQCAPVGGVIVPIPLPFAEQPEAMRYAAAAGAAFSMPEGFFIGPYGRGQRASVGVPRRSTSWMLYQVAVTGTPPVINDDYRAQARKDLAVWKADCVVLTSTEHHDELQATLEALFGRGQVIADAITWRVTELRAGKAS